MRSNTKTLLILSALMIAIFFSWSEDVSAATQNEMRIHFIDVGQGDSILVTTPSGKNILIDGGTPDAGKKITNYLKEQDIKKIDVMIATHPDFDHIGGLARVMRKIDTKEVIDTGKVHRTKTYARYLKEIRKQNIPITIAQENDQVDIDPKVSLQILNAFNPSKDNNESSLVLRITYNNFSILLMADAEHEQEKRILKEHQIKADIIKVGHHGSNTSSRYAFLKEVDAKTAILTYSKDNNYGHPVSRVIHNLQKLNMEIYSTAVFGDIIIYTQGDSYFVLPTKSPQDGILSSAN